jgi:hypothetical protein
MASFYEAADLAQIDHWKSLIMASATTKMKYLRTWERTNLKYGRSFAKGLVAGRDSVRIEFASVARASVYFSFTHTAFHHILHSKTGPSRGISAMKAELKSTVDRKILNSKTILKYLRNQHFRAIPYGKLNPR